MMLHRLLCEVEMYHFQLLAPVLSETPTTAHVSLQTCDTAVLDFVENNLLVVATLGVVLVLVEVSCDETLGWPTLAVPLTVDMSCPSLSVAGRGVPHCNLPALQHRVLLAHLL